MEFSCDVDYDPFALMKEKDMKYGKKKKIVYMDAAVPCNYNMSAAYRFPV